jgi:hypothetical protein
MSVKEKPAGFFGMTEASILKRASQVNKDFEGLWNKTRI